MRVTVCGGTGFIGRAVVAALLARGDEVTIVTRGVPTKPLFDSALPQPEFVSWEQWRSDPDHGGGCDAVVNLTGESINQRWTARAKARIVASRTGAAASVADAVARMSRKPAVVVNASGLSLNDLTDDAEPGSARAAEAENAAVVPVDFLGRTVAEWEEAINRIPVDRIVKLRISLVCAREGGIFPLVRFPYRLFVGGRVGNGKQGMPWIHIRDMVGLTLFCLDNPAVSGPVNACAPDTATNDEFGRKLGRAIRRPHWFPVPSFALKLLLGEMSSLVLTGPFALPHKALNHGYRFAFPTLEEALRDLTR